MMHPFHNRRPIAVPAVLVLLVGWLSVTPLLAAEDESSGDEVNYIELAARLIGDGNYGRAEAALRNVDPAAEDVDRARYFTLQGLVSLRQGNNAAAVDALERAIEARRATPEAERSEDDVRSLRLAHLYLAQAQFRRENYRETLAALEEAGPVADEIASVHALRAQAHWKLGQRVQAVAALNRGDARFPDDPQFQRRKVFYLIELGFYRRAAEVGQAYLDRGKATPEDYLAIGSALRKSSQYRAALGILERARLRYPRHRKIAIELAHVYLDQDRVGLAADIFAETAVHHPEIQSEAAELQRRAGRLYRALLLNASIADQEKKLKQRLAIFIAMERWEQAASMGDALRRQRLLDDGSIRYAYAYALFKSGEYDEADEMLSGLRDEDLFRKATELRKAMETCRQARWKCL